MLDLEDTKLFLRVDQDVEDGIIQAMIDAATAATADYLNMPADQLTATVPSPIKSATLLMVADLYANRERQSGQALYRNDTFERLLNPYRVMEA